MADTNAAPRSRVLFVDDEPRILFTLKALFRNDYEVSIAHSGSEAVALLKSKEFDVIVSDQRMPSMPGIEVLRAARLAQPRATRLLLTGYSDLNAIIGSINEGEIFRFVNKPWVNDELRATIADAAAAAKVAPAPAAADTAPEAAVTAAAATTPVDTAATAAAAAAASGVGVLVLDDDPAMCSEMRQTLGGSHSLFVANTLEQCVGLLEENQNIGVIVTETLVNGERVEPMLSALRQHQPSLVTIVITAEADAHQAINLINHSQIYRFLQKPANASVLRGTVNLASRRSELLRKDPEQARRLPVMPPPPLKTLEARGLLGRIRRLWSATAA